MGAENGGTLGTDRRERGGGYRIVSESGTVFATVSTAEDAAVARAFYAERYGCIVQVVRTENKPQRW